jgi:hypothetical protein
MNDNIIELFRGTFIDASYISELLEDNNIEFIIRDYQKESAIAGWAGGISEDSVSLFVSENDIDAASKILNDFLKSEVENQKTE